MLNKIYGLVRAGRGLLNIFFNDKFEHSEVDRHVLRKFNDGEMEIVVFVHVDDILVYSEATMERFAAELEESLK